MEKKFTRLIYHGFITCLFFLAATLQAQITQVFTYTGNTQTFTVPAGVTSLQIKAWGAGGGGSNAFNNGGSGGSGAFITATLQVSAGEQYTIQVGGGGKSGPGIKAGGYAGGGSGGRQSGSGGGYSAVFFRNIIGNNTRVVAGGGGGGAYESKSTYGGAGSGAHAANMSSTITGGKTPGSSGLYNGDARGATAGTQFQGGKGSTRYSTWIGDVAYDNGGGGGGGGLAGGGGGVGSDNGWSLYDSTGGGGGSSYTHSTLATSVTLIPGNTGNTGDWVPAPANTDINYIAGVGRGGENQANGGNGLIVITYTEGECTGDPTGGSAVLTPNTGTVGSLFTANVTGGTIGALGLTYEWEMSVGSATGPWTAIPGATTASVQLTAPNEPPGTKIYYRRKITCVNSGSSVYSSTAIYTIYSPSYCDPESFIYNDYYIKGVRFLGTLNDVQNLNNGYSDNPKGYQDWTGLGNYASQEQGGAINLAVENSRESVMAAWVDWNNNGSFEAAEQIYNTSNSYVGATIIGFSVPAAQAIGYYRIRIRVSENAISNDPTTNCQDFTNGETEDYLFQVLKACDAKVTSFSVSERCGAGTLPITINTVNANSVKIYTAENANNPIASVNVTNNSATYTTALISETTVYYVAAANGTCEARHRVKIIAKVNPLPNIDFDNSAREFCGDASGTQTLQFAALGDKETVELVNENFNTNLGAFTATQAGQHIAPWTHRTSNFIPSSVIQPAIASGISGDGFAASVTDVGTGSNRANHLTTTAYFNTTGFLNLHLDYNIYTFFEGIKPDVEKVNVEVSPDNGANWFAVKTYSPTTTGNVGLPNKFLEETVDLNAYRNVAELKVRFSIYAYATGAQWSGDIGAVDKVRLYGEKPLVAAYSWSVNNGDAILFNDDCITPYNGATNSICVKPSAALLELRPSWKITATASLSNGCNASGEVEITNNNKTFQTTETGWAAGADWKPSGVPDATKCVIIKSPVTINSLTSNYQAFAKKVKIEAPGTLTVKSDATYASSLTVSEEFINNNTAENSVVLENNTSLKQLSGSTGINHGNITVHRNLDFTGARNEYNYLSTPVTFASGQSYKTIYPGVTSANYPSVLYYVESTRYFLQSSGANILGRSSAVKEAGTLSGITNNRAEFKGVPYVGDFTYPLAYSSTGLGFNLVGNPYPSNVDLQELYSHNSLEIDADFRFWDNKVNDNGGQQHGAGYNGRAYARYNAISDIGNEAGYYFNTSHPIIGSKKPNKILKVGQGMMVQALGPGKSLSWNNAPNVKTVDNADSVFFGKTSPDNRYWLTMKTPDNLILTAAFTYIPELSNAFEKGDSKVTSGESDSFYSMTSDAEKVVINARSIFNTDDVVPLGTTHYAAGIYTISLGDHEGIFANGQNVYLKDKELNIVTNLSEGPYSFTSNSGQFTNRFEIVYLPQTTLDVTGFNKESVQIYRDGEDFVVKASTKNIKDVELYEMSGKLIFKKSSATREVRINAAHLANGIYMVRAFLDNGEVTTKKVRY